MILCAAGDIHGALGRLYDDVLRFEDRLGVRFAFVLHVGDFGVWPDPALVDRATRNHDGAGDFSGWLAQSRSAPRPTVFIKGNHEDFGWLESRPTTEVLPGLRYLRNGTSVRLEHDGEALEVGGVGGCFGPSDFARMSGHLQGRARRHYTSDEVEVLSSKQGLDIILTHDAPAGVEFNHPWRGPYVSGALGLDSLVQLARPRVCFFGHHHARVDAVIHGVRCLGLNQVGRPGNLVAISMPPGGGDWEILGEWAPRA